MACLDQIVTLGICPDDGASLSGFTLLQADGISLKNLANIADEDNITGVNLAMEKKTLSITQVKNDFIAALQSNRIVTTLSNQEYKSARFITGIDGGTYAGYRGQTLHKVPFRGKLRKTVLKSIDCYPLQSGNTTIRIDDGVNVYNYNVTVVANQVNTFDADVLSGFPFEIDKQSNSIEVTIDQTSIAFAKSEIICHKGCNGTAPNNCGWVDGWTGTGAIKAEGYGLNLNFYCECDYGQILCDLANSYVGELIWLKWQINIFKEQLKSNRFNNWVIYNQEQINETILPDLISQYNSRWNALMEGSLGILKSYGDDCLNCRGVRWQVTI